MDRPKHEKEFVAEGRDEVGCDFGKDEVEKRLGSAGGGETDVSSTSVKDTRHVDPTRHTASQHDVY